MSVKSYRAGLRVQELVFDVARGLTKQFLNGRPDGLPAHVLFPQFLEIVRRYVNEKVRVSPGYELRDLFFSPYYGWLIETLVESIRPDTSAGDVPELPRYETTRGPGSTADVSFWTSKKSARSRGAI